MIAQRLAFVSAALILLSGCQHDSNPTTSDHSCAPDITPISSVQGDGDRSPLLGNTVSVHGVVTRINGAGLFLESVQPDDSPQTSEALYLKLQTPLNGVSTGALLSATGKVTELGNGRDTQTALLVSETPVDCEQNHSLPLATLDFPIEPDNRESLENMRVMFTGQLAVTDVYNLKKGKVWLSSEQPLPSPTEIARPGKDAREQMNWNRAHSISTRLNDGDRQVFSVGSILSAVPGVMGHDGRYAQWFLESNATITVPNQPTLANPDPSDIRIVSLNLHNFFNGDGQGAGFPTPRGAETPEEFSQQRNRLAASIRFLQPDVLAVMELENDGFGPFSAAADLIRDLDEHVGGQWAAIAPAEQIGTDQIKVGLFYRTDRVRPVGEAHTLDAAPFDLLSRVPVAQSFALAGSSESVLVVVNHFKSKGSCPDQGRDMNQNDGQGCWNPARTESSVDLVRLTRQIAMENSAGRALLVGDFNAYRMEDPIQELVDSGFIDLTAPASLQHEYSYVYRGETGTLDHALASPALQPYVRLAQIIHINAAYPRNLPLEPDWLGSSDHDPVVVDVRLSQSSTSD